MGNLTNDLSKSNLFTQAVIYSLMQKTIDQWFEKFEIQNDYTFFFKIKQDLLEISIKSSNSALLSIIKTQKTEFAEYLMQEIELKLKSSGILKVQIKTSFK
jgi:hypothetical protein